MPPDDAILLHREAMEKAQGSVATITLNRPHQLNAINSELLTRMDLALDDVAKEPGIRALFITGSGRAFSSGGDLKEYRISQQDRERFPEFVSELQRTFARLRFLRIPVIALVNGVTAAGGLELLLSCDIVLAASSALIGDAHLNFGQMGGGGVLTLLPRLVGIQRTMDLVLSGRFLTAPEALDWGLVSRVVPAEDLRAAGMDLAYEIARKSPLAVANAKYVANSIWSERLGVSAGLRLESERNNLYCLTADDAREGLMAFAEKRKPQFRGR